MKPLTLLPSSEFANCDRSECPTRLGKRAKENARFEPRVVGQLQGLSRKQSKLIIIINKNEIENIQTKEIMYKL